MTARSDQAVRGTAGLVARPVVTTGPRPPGSWRLTAAERAMVIDGFNPVASAPPRRATVADLIHERAAAAPDAVAVVWAGHRPQSGNGDDAGGTWQLTYRELSARASRLAARLRATGIGPGTVVGVCARRSPELLVGQLGALTAGAGYLPLDPAEPPDRLAAAIETAGVRLVLAEPAATARLPHPAATLPLTGDEAGTGPDDAAAAPDDGRRGARARLDDVAYLGYPCGPADRPAAVEIEQGSLVNLLQALCTELGGGPDDSWLAAAAPASPRAVPELYLPLLVGARVVIADDAATASARALLATVRRYSVTHLAADPETWRSLLAAGFDEPDVVAIVSGAAVDLALAREVREHVRRLSVMYGEPEATVWSTTYPVPAAPDRISLGRPMLNTRVYVLDERLRPVPVGEPGEVYLGGAGLARGYRDRPTLTAARFLPDPFGDAGGRLFRTGMTGRWRTGGTLEYLGGHVDAEGRGAPGAPEGRRAPGEAERARGAR